MFEGVLLMILLLGGWGGVRSVSIFPNFDFIGLYHRDWVLYWNY